MLYGDQRLKISTALDGDVIDRERIVWTDAYGLAQL